MPKLSRPRYGSLQFWPRKRAIKALPRVNWENLSKKNKAEGEGLMGFIGYKVGMVTAIVKDDTEKSMTKGKRKAIPATILEIPTMKIYCVRFYKNGLVMKDIIVSNDKELKRKLKVPKNVGNSDLLDKVEGYDDVRVIAYSNVKQTGLKKSPDIVELDIKAADKKEFIKKLVGKDIGLEDFVNFELADVRGLTKGKGLQGPVRRFGITLKSHKSEKGRRNPGSIGPWHPARVTFRVPMSGQLGNFSRVHYNLVVLDKANIKDKDINKKSGFRHYGKIRSNYIILSGSVQGPSKRQILVSPGLRPNKSGMKKKYELVEIK